MITNIFNLSSENCSNVFIDVEKDTWYENAVYNVYKNGFMRGKTQNCFCPEEYLTIEELVAAIVRIDKNKNGISGESKV